DRPRKSKTTGSTALRSTNASTTCERSVFILIEHAPRSNSGVRGDYRCDWRHQTLHRPVARHELDAQRFGKLRDVSMRNALTEGAGALFHSVIELLEDGVSGGNPCVHPAGILYSAI